MQQLLWLSLWIFSKCRCAIFSKGHPLLFFLWWCVTLLIYRNKVCKHVRPLLQNSVKTITKRFRVVVQFTGQCWLNLGQHGVGAIVEFSHLAPIWLHKLVLLLRIDPTIEFRPWSKKIRLFPLRHFILSRLFGIHFNPLQSALPISPATARAWAPL